MPMLETPSRIWRRIEAVEGRDMPSLPSLPAYDDSIEVSSDGGVVDISDHLNLSTPIHSTPATSSHQTLASTLHPSSSSSTARFAQSIATRSTKSTMSVRHMTAQSFDISVIPSLPDTYENEDNQFSEEMENGETRESLPNIYLPPEDEEDALLTDALQSLSRSGSPSPHEELENAPTPKKAYDYSISLRSEPKPSPYDRYRNVSFRKPISRTRTPSLSRTTSSEVSSSTHSTPPGSRSVSINYSDFPLPNSSGLQPQIISESPSIIINDDDVAEGLVTGEDHGLSLSEFQEHDSHSINPINFDVETDPERSEEECEYSQSAPHSDDKGNCPSNEREPTSSSKEVPPSGRDNKPRCQISLPTTLSLSSPAPSATFSPTPAFPRPKARFNVQALSDTPHQQQTELQNEDPVTPHTRRRSFLLSVINSTSRPRLKFPTPHPRRSDFNAQDSSSDTQLTPCINLQTAFAGATPRPRARARLSHPLAQTYTASPIDSSSDSGRREALPHWATPTSDGERASFISTTSSHDLTTHQRVNTSFDPVMGLGAQGHGVGRFNAGKLNAYLHGLNRKLQEENEVLVQRLRRVEEDKTATFGSSASEGSRRVSLTGTALEDVEEDVGEEGWVEEKVALEKMVEAFRIQLQRSNSEKEETETALDEERKERARDKERWRERMAEVEKGVGEIVKALEEKLQDAEKRVKDVERSKGEVVMDSQRRLAEAEEGRNALVERVRKAEQALESGQELGGELRAANERVEKVMGDLRNANLQIRELQDEVMRSDGRVDELEKDLKEEKEFAEHLEAESKGKLRELASVYERLKSMEDEFQHVEEEMRVTKTYAADLEEGAETAIERIESLEEKLASARARIDEMSASEEQANEKLEKLERETQRKADLARQMEEALDAAEKKMLADEEEIADLKGRVATLQREKEREREKSDHPMELSRARTSTEADVEALEDELDDANREIARLTTLLDQSPARKAIDKAKDTKIELLEMEKEELMERVKALRMAMSERGTPSRISNASGISPIHRHVLSMSIRGPKTPGGPLRELSWLNNTADPTAAPLLAEISRLQKELDLANESIDDKLDKLEDASLGVVGLTKRLEDARSRIVSLEDEIARLSRREARRLHRLERVKCQKCHGKMDLRGVNRGAEGDESSIEMSHATAQSDPPTPPTRTSEALRKNLRFVNAQLDSLKNQWVAERSRLLGEKAALQDAANQLNAEVFDIKEQMRRVAEIGRDGDKQRIGVQEELEKAKEVIAHLESDLKSERARLRGLSIEQNRVKRQKEEVLLQLQRTESDMEDVKGMLHRFKQENHDLERELRANATADQKARLLEAKVTENTETIEQLRQERSLLTTDHKELQRRFSEISEQVNRLRDEYATVQMSHDNRRHQLDLHLGEIDDLHRALSEKADELHRAEAEKRRVAAEKSDVARTVAALDADLNRVRKNAETLGCDLRTLRAEKEKSEAEQKKELSKIEKARREAHAQVRLLTDQLESQRQKAAKAKQELQNHVCVVDEHQLSAIKLQHNKECKGLIEQIRYLKAKFTRESSLRFALGYQKQYLAVLLSKFQKSEETIFAAIARIGFPMRLPNQPKKARSLKSVALSVVFVLRAKNARNLWKEQCASKEAIAAALQEVRRRR